MNKYKHILKWLKSFGKSKGTGLSLEQQIANQRFKRIPSAREHARFNPNVKKTRSEWNKILQYRKENKGNVWKLFHERKNKGKNKIKFNKETGRFFTIKGIPPASRPPVLKGHGGAVGPNGIL